MSEKVCETCAYRSDGLNAKTADYCYQFDKEVDRDAPGCPEWRGSLRDEPLEDAPVREVP